VQKQQIKKRDGACLFKILSNVGVVGLGLNVDLIVTSPLFHGASYVFDLGVASVSE
jgi:hypothetical protein